MYWYASQRVAGAAAWCCVWALIVGCSERSPEPHPSAVAAGGPPAHGGVLSVAGSTTGAAGGPSDQAGSSSGGQPAGVQGGAGGAGTAAGGEPGASLDGKPFVYVGTSFYDSAARTLVVLQLDRHSGQLTTVQTVADLEGIPSWLAVAPSRQFLYVNLEDVPGAIAFNIDQATGALTRVNAITTNQQSSAYLSLDATGRFALQANYEGGTASVISIGNDGSLGAVVDTRDFGGGSYPHSVRVDATNRFALVTNRGSGSEGNDIWQFEFDAATGKLMPINPPSLTLPANTGPRHLDFHPNGRFAYTTNERASAVGAYEWDAAAGTLQSLQQVSSVPQGVSGAAPTDIHVHPSGKFVYAINRNEWSIALFSIDEVSGMLSFVEHTKLGAGSPRNFAIDPHGSFLVVGHLEGNAVRVLSIDAATGKLAPLGNPTQIASPSGIAITYLPGN